MKRLTIVLSTLGLSSTIFAALPATNDPTLIAVPQLPGGFIIGATGYYLQPSFSHRDLDYATVDVGTTSPFSSRLRAVEPGYDWGWGVNLGYIFPNTGNDVNLSYFHLDTNETNSLSPGSPVGNQFLTADIIADPDVIVNNYIANAKAEYDLNRVDLTAGQFIDVGCRLILHPSVGISYLNLERKLNSSYLGAVTGVFAGAVLETLTDNTTIHEKSEFDGIGPIANLDASYYIGQGFGLVGHADAGLYIGDMDVKTNGLRISSGQLSIPGFPLFLGVIDSSLSESNRHIVPATDVKLGADYNYLFNNAANSSLTLEVGYQVSHYFNAIDRLNSALGNAIVNGPGTAFTVTAPTITGHSTSDLGINGPYVNLTWHI